MKRRVILTILFAAVGWGFTTTPALSADAAPAALGLARQGIEREFGRLDAALKRAAQTLGQTGLTGGPARAALAELCGGFDAAVDCAAVDRSGRMVTIEPAPFRVHEGKDIGAQEQVRRLMKTGKPVLSRVFRSVEGLPAADAEYPVSAPDGRRLGAVSLLFLPEKLLGGVIVPLVKGIPANTAPPGQDGLQIWVMEDTGRILYDVDAREIGQDLFTAPMYKPYPGLIRLGRHIARRSSGSGAYEFLKDTDERTVIRKRAHWQTVSLYGTAWRLVAVHPSP